MVEVTACCSGAHRIHAAALNIQTSDVVRVSEDGEETYMVRLLSSVAPVRL